MSAMILESDMRELTFDEVDAVTGGFDLFGAAKDLVAAAVTAAGVAKCAAAGAAAPACGAATAIVAIAIQHIEPGDIKGYVPSLGVSPY